MYIKPYKTILITVKTFADYAINIIISFNCFYFWPLYLPAKVSLFASVLICLELFDHWNRFQNDSFKAEVYYVSEPRSHVEQVNNW